MNYRREQPGNRVRFLALLLVYLTQGFVFGQSKAEILTRLSDASGKDKVHLYLELSKIYTPQSDSSINYAQQAFQLGYKINYPDGMVIALKEVSRLQYENSAYLMTIKTSTRAIQLTEHYQLDSFNLGTLHFQIGRALEEIGAFSEAIYHRKEQLKWKTQSANPLVQDQNLYYLINRIALNFLALEEIDSAQVYFNKALDVALETKNLQITGHAYNDIGFCHVKKNQIDSAIYYYGIGLEKFLSLPEKSGRDSLMIGVIQGNIGRFLPASDPNKIIYLQHNIDWGKSQKSSSQLARAYLKMAESLTEAKYYSKSLAYLDSAKHILSSEKESHGMDQLVLYKAYVDCYGKSGNYDLAVQNFERYISLNDSLYGKKAFYANLKQRSSYELLMIESELLIEQYQVNAGERKIKLLSQEKEISQLRIYLLIIGALLLLTIAIVVMFRMRAVARKKRKRQEEETQMLERNIEDKDERLNLSVMGLKRKSDFAVELIQKINALESIDSREKQMLKLFIENELSIDTSTLEMEDYIHEAGKDFFLRLKLTHPNLNENEIKLIALIKMNLTIKQMAIIKNITPNSVKVAKNRLRKKLDLSPGSSIPEYLDKI